MSLNDAILPEFDHEMATTRRLLDRLPEAQTAWQPHPKSMTLGRLASHLAEIPAWVASTLKADSFDTAPPGGTSYVPPSLGSRHEILALFDKNSAMARAAIAGTSDGEYMKPWSLMRGGKIVFTMPRIGVVRSFLLNHLIHHRGQFTVYLRMKNVSLPSVYGPTADETGM